MRLNLSLFQRPVLLAVVVGVAAGVVPSAPGATAQAAPAFNGPSESAVEAALGSSGRSFGGGDEAPAANPKLSSHLAKLARAERHARASGTALRASNLGQFSPEFEALAAARLMRLDEGGRVQVYVEGPVEFAEAAVRAAGGEVQRTEDSSGSLQALVPVSRLEDLALNSSVKSVRLPDYPLRNTGSVTSQGDYFLRAVLARYNYPTTGAGVRVGVISDGLEGLATSRLRGDLPSLINSSTCNMVPQAPTSAGAGAEGTAMLEIVHDLAPGAELWFGHFGFGFSGTSLDFQAAANCLAANTDVVVDDIGFFNNGPYDGSSPVSVNASNARNGPGPIRAYVNAVGNQAMAHYEEPYVDHDGAGSLADVHRFGATADTVDACSLGPGPADPILLPPGGRLTVALQWNDAFGASANDYDLFLVRDDNGATVASSVDPQDGNDDPTEILGYVNNTGVTRQFDIVIDRFSGAGRMFDMFILGDALIVGPPGCAAGPAEHNYNTQRSSVPNNSDAGGGVISTGTINATSYSFVTPYSSRGPTNDLRTKPDVTGVDGVYITGSGGFPSPFYGTSAAAPHIAAIAALLLHCKPALKAGEPGDNAAGDRTAVRDALLNTADDYLPLGVDNSYGSGLANALRLADNFCPTPFGPPSHGNILVSSSNTPDNRAVYEYTNAGSRVQKARILYPLETDHGANRDHVLLSNGNIAFHNGTSNSYLDVYNPATRTWTHHTAPEWSGVGNSWYGGTAAYQQYVFVTDSGPGATDNGIIRFDTTDYSWQRFASTPIFELHYWDLTIGLDGLLYGLTAGGSQVHIFDPVSLEQLKTVVLYIRARGIAVDGAGDIFATTGGGEIAHFGRGGQLLGRVNTSANFGDIDISPTDQLVAGGVQRVYVSTTAVTSYTSFPVPDSDVDFVSFVRYAPASDVDGDSIDNALDNCPNIANINQANLDTDPAGNACDPDDDNDDAADLSDNCPLLASASQSDGDTDGHGDVCDICPATWNVGQIDNEADGIGDECDPDDDNDGFDDVLESACGSNTFVAGSLPERIDTPADDDGDTLVNEIVSTNPWYDCDHDGYDAGAENSVGTSNQDPCGGTGWPSDLSPGIAANALNVADLGSFIAPVRRMGTSTGGPGFDARWDIVPGSTFGATINVQDMAATITGASGYPPMFAGQRAFGRVCPWAP